MSKSTEIVEDFLEADDQIRGQNFVCLSFVSPESVLKNKDLFKMQNFLRHLVKNNNINLSEDYINKLDEKYKDFLYSREETLEKDFYENNDFRTTIRGLKVRGVYDSVKEANMRAAKLQKKDKNFNVYVGQVGYWLPWDPEPHQVGEQEYFESDLNQLVKKYKENQEAKETHFRENVEYVKEQARKEVEEKKTEQSGNKVEEALKQTLEGDDPWIAAKKREDTINNTDNNETV